jgi:hypothetical protein
VMQGVGRILAHTGEHVRESTVEPAGRKRKMKIPASLGSSHVVALPPSTGARTTQRRQTCQTPPRRRPCFRKGRC